MDRASGVAGQDTDISGDRLERAVHRARVRERAARHSRRVRRLRLVVPLAGGILALGLLVLAAMPTILSVAGLEGVEITADGLVMNNPRLSGHLDADRRYSVEARRAVQSILDPSELKLEAIVAELEMAEDGWVRITGNRAFYDTDTEILELMGGVSINSSEGTEARLESASVFLKDGRVVSPEAVDIASPRGAIRAGRIDVEDSGEVIRMRGGVSITIDPAAADAVPGGASN